ncbi:hypothetical protein Pint_28595 [Pistacia integerrima]|uniref:Uncharacterized protein n=1 Tax=Pistacia integerrima TaxID=434235 RepID=A0ACC0YPY8_9ROSI|nr:hypothetical protein Pint_28595 [Pistacia integerrima]
MAIEEDVESCGSRAAESQSLPNSRLHRHKFEVYGEVLRRLQDLNFEEANRTDFDNELWVHFNRLPARYALDVNVDRAEDVLTHKRLLHLAKDPANRPVFEVRVVQVYPTSSVYSVDSDSSMNEDVQSSYYLSKQGVHPPPTFSSSPNFEALALCDNKDMMEEEDSTESLSSCCTKPMHEITFSTVDKPKLLTQLMVSGFPFIRYDWCMNYEIGCVGRLTDLQLTSLLSEIGLNIQEAHAFSTVDGFSLDVFVVDGWPLEDTAELKCALEKEVMKSRDHSFFRQHSVSAVNMHNPVVTESFPNCVEIPTDGTDVWEIVPRQLAVEMKVSSGAYGDLYKGTYCSQEVAIKVLKREHVDTDMLKEFSQEVYIMRKIRHKNVVQFIGACTRPPNLCIVTEFMARGSIHDFLHTQKGVFDLPSLLKVVKVADFGVARVQAQSGVMTAETGTYRWMAPEVIGHKPYDHKADVFSFGIVLWELISAEIPYSGFSPLQAAVAVVQKGLRPSIPKHSHPKLTELIQRCWHSDPIQRPNFSEITDILQQLIKEVAREREDNRSNRSAGGLF